MKSDDNCKYSTFQCDARTIEYDNSSSVKYYSDFLNMNRNTLIKYTNHAESIPANVMKVYIQDHKICTDTPKLDPRKKKPQRVGFSRKYPGDKLRWFKKWFLFQGWGLK